MATIEKVTGGWRARIRRKGQDRSATFPRKAQAQAWAVEAEREIFEGVQYGKTLYMALARYRDEVSPTKRGHKWEYTRLNYFMKSMKLLDVTLSEVTPAMIAQWRDDRLKSVASPTVRREMGLLTSVFEVARREWQWCRANPCRDVKRPPQAQGRSRRITDEEIERIKFALGYEDDEPAISVGAQTAVAFLLGLQTAMRAGEMLRLTTKDIDFENRTAKLRLTKNGHSRVVPLTEEAIRLIKQLVPTDDGRIFSTKPTSIDAMFRKYRKKAGVDELHFHDSRHEAISRMARLPGMDVLTLARISGHRDIRELMTYFHPDMSDVAKSVLQTKPQPQQ